jgi:hypothetical protein
MLLLNTPAFLLAYRRRYAFHAWRVALRPGDGG